MTKKSAARLERDKQKSRAAEFSKSNQAWDDLRNLYTGSQNELNTMTQSVKGFFSVPDVGRFIPPDQGDYVVKVIRGFSADLKGFQDRLNNLYKQHKDRAGMLNTDAPGEYTFMIQLWSAYIDYKRDVDTILTPIYHQILAVMQVTEANIAAIASRPAETDSEQTPNAE